MNKNIYLWKNNSILFQIKFPLLTNQSFQFIDQEKKKTTKHKMTDEFFFDKGKDESILNFKRS